MSIYGFSIGLIICMIGLIWFIGRRFFNADRNSWQPLTTIALGAAIMMMASQHAGDGMSNLINLM